MYQRILFPVDLHEQTSWERALPTVLTLGRTFQAELHVLTIFPDIPVGLSLLYMPEDTEHRLAEAAAKGLDEFVAAHVPADIAVVKHVETGRGVYGTILETAERIGADLIAMASHRPESSDYLIGTNSSRVVRHARASVLVIR